MSPGIGPFPEALLDLLFYGPEEFARSPDYLPAAGVECDLVGPDAIEPPISSSRARRSLIHHKSRSIRSQTAVFARLTGPLRCQSWRATEYVFHRSSLPCVAGVRSPSQSWMRPPLVTPFRQRSAAFL